MMRVPSGDHRGAPSLKLPVVKGRLLEPSKLTIQRLEQRLSVITSLNCRTYMTFSPSGEICGSAAVSISKMSIGVSRSDFSCPTTAETEHTRAAIIVNRIG